MSHSKKYDSTYVGEVVSVADPDKRCRIKVNVYDVFDGVPVASLPWANFVLPLGSRPGEGAINPVQVGDKVWVRFVEGDSRRPLIIGSAQASPGGKVNLAPDVCQGDGQYQHKRTDKQPKPEAAPYYEDVVYCQNHALIQLCRSGTIRVTQMTSGSAIEITPAGHMIMHCEGDMFASVKGNTLEEYDGDLKQIIKGNFEKIVEGSMTETSTGEATFASTGSSLALGAKTQGTMTGGGGLRFEGPTTMKDDLSCEQNVTAQGSIMDAAGNSNHHSH